jgi:hypothetical protein
MKSISVIDQPTQPAIDEAKPEKQFGGFPELMELVPNFSDRSLRKLIQDGVIPHIRPPGGRKFLFHLPSVIAALKRMQRGGLQ